MKCHITSRKKTTVNLSENCLEKMDDFCRPGPELLLFLFNNPLVEFQYVMKD